MTQESFRVSLFSDSCPDETIQTIGNEDRLHTLVTVVANQDKVERIKNILLSHYRGFLFGKWVKPSKGRSRSRKSEYRKVIREHLMQAVAGTNCMVVASSFCESTARFLYPRLLQEFKIEPLESFTFIDHTNRKRVKFLGLHTEWDSRMGALLEGEVMAMLMIADGIASCYREIYNSPLMQSVSSRHHKWVIVTDFLSGDSARDQRRGSLLSWLLERIRPGCFEIRYWIPGDKDNEGELLADNLAGAMNEALNEPLSNNANQFWDAVPAYPKHPIWYLTHPNFTFARIFDPRKKIPSAVASEGDVK